MKMTDHLLSQNPDIADRPQTIDQPVFDAFLTPHRSMPREGFIRLMIFLFAVFSFFELAFIFSGFWPVTFFLLLSNVMILVAFLINYRDGRCYEQICISQLCVHIRRVDAAGNARDIKFNPFWTRLYIDFDVEDGVRAIEVRERARTVQIGDFLNPVDRTTLAHAVKRALSSLNN